MCQVALACYKCCVTSLPHSKIAMRETSFPQSESFMRETSLAKQKRYARDISPQSNHAARERSFARSLDHSILLRPAIWDENTNLAKDSYLQR